MSESSPAEPVEQRQLARLAALDDLLPTLAGVLDIRDVFERVSRWRLTLRKVSRCRK